MCIRDRLTIFLSLKTLRMVLFLLGHIVVTLLALRTCQCNLNAHDFHLQCFHLHGLSCIPVSYTHLDVYKRQALDYTFKDKGYPNIFLGTVEAYPSMETLLKMISSYHPSKVCLLYTSRCV